MSTARKTFDQYNCQFHRPPQYRHFNFHRWLIISILSFSAFCGIVEKSTFLGNLKNFVNKIFVFYWHMLDRIFYFFSGSQHGFSSLFVTNIGWFMVIFLAPLLVGFFAVKLLLKQNNRVYQHIIILLYAWHSLSFFVHTSTQWMTVIIIVGTALSLCWILKLVRIAHRNF